MNSLIDSFNSDPFFCIDPKEYIPNVASLLVRFLQEMQTNKHFLWGPTEQEAQVFEDRYQQVHTEQASYDLADW